MGGRHHPARAMGSRDPTAPDNDPARAVISSISSSPSTSWSGAEPISSNSIRLSESSRAPSGAASTLSGRNSAESSWLPSRIVHSGDRRTEAPGLLGPLPSRRVAPHPRPAGGHQASAHAWDGRPRGQAGGADPARADSRVRPLPPLGPPDDRPRARSSTRATSPREGPGLRGAGGPRPR